MSRRKKHKHRGPQQGQGGNAVNHRQGGGGGSSQGQEPRVIQADNPHQAVKGQIPIQSVMTPRRNIFKKQMHQRNVAAATKKYGLVFYETLQAARNDQANIANLATQYDQLNIVIRAETTVETTDLAQFGKVFTGAAWTLIHERRKQDGWYDESHE